MKFKIQIKQLFITIFVLLTYFAFLYLCYQINYSVASQFSLFEIILCAIGFTCPLIMIFGLGIIIYKILKT